MPILQRPGEIIPGQFGPISRECLRLQKIPGVDHVPGGNAFGDADDQRQAGVGSFHDGVGRARRRNEDHGRVGAGLIHRFAYGVEDGPAFMRGAAFARGHSPDHGGAIGRGILGVEGAFPSGQSLHQQSRRFIHQDAHNFCHSPFAPSEQVTTTALPWHTPVHSWSKLVV